MAAAPWRRCECWPTGSGNTAFREAIAFRQGSSEVLFGRGGAARVAHGRPSALSGRLAGEVGFERCAGPAFRKLPGVLAAWFRVAGAGGAS